MVKVIGVDIERRRIQLSMKKLDMQKRLMTEESKDEEANTERLRQKD